MKTIEIVSNTEYFAKKRIIAKSIEFFISNKEEYFVNVKSYWTDYYGDGKEHLIKVIVRREIISQFIGFDFVKHSNRLNTNLAPKTKEEIMLLYRVLTNNEKYVKNEINETENQNAQNITGQEGN